MERREELVWHARQQKRGVFDLKLAWFIENLWNYYCLTVIRAQLWDDQEIDSFLMSSDSFISCKLFGTIIL